VSGAPLALAFTAGLIAAFNPCGFALLPAYLSYFVGLEDRASAVDRPSVARPLVVGATVTAGFVAVFGTAGVAVTAFSLRVQTWSPWLSIVIGSALAVLGVAMLRGFQPKLALPTLSAGTKGRGLGAMFAFGVSYATVSLSCTLPVFLAAVATTFQDTSFGAGVATFVAYALGMGAVLMVLTVALALARRSMVARLRQVLPMVQRLSGGLLLIAGAYVAYYGWYEIQINRGRDVVAGPVDFVTDASGTVSNWVAETGGVRLGVIIAVLLVAIVAATTALRTTQRRRVSR